MTQVGLLDGLTDQQTLKKLIQLGIALSAMRDLPGLLRHILYEARQLTQADAGSIYVAEGDRLKFVVSQCDRYQPEFRESVTEDNFFGTIDRTYLRIEDEDFFTDPLYRPLESSGGWITDTRDTLYDLFRNTPTDSTIIRKFLFWVRCRDRAQVADLTPAWTQFHAIQPRYERDVMVIDFSKTLLRWNAPYPNDTDTAFEVIPPTCEVARKTVGA